MLERLLSASIQGVVAIAAVAVLVRLFRQIGPHRRCWLWRLCWLKMLLSLVWIAEIPLLSAPSSLPDESLLNAVPIPSPASSVAPAALPALAPGYTLEQGLMAIWLLGALLSAALTIRATIRAQRILRPSRPAGDEVERLAEDLARSMGLSSRPPIRLQEGLRSPCLAGLARSTIYLPAGMEATEIKFALAHELAHVKRRDTFWLLGQSVAVSVFWFLPVVPLAAKAARMEAEMACDTEAMKVSQAKPADYARLLVKLAASSQPAFAIQMAAKTRLALERRLIEMQRPYPQKTNWRLIAALLPLSLLALVPGRAVSAAAPLPAGPQAVSLKARAAGIVSWPGVALELGLSSVQKQGLIRSRAQEYREIRALGDKLAAIGERGGSVKERYEYDQKTRKPIFRRNDDRMWNILTVSQRDRLCQLTCQYYGPQTAYAKEIADMLGLSEGQRKELKALTEEYHRFMGNQERGQFRDISVMKPIKIRDLTTAEKNELAKIAKEYYTATGKRRDELIRRRGEIQMRGQKYPVMDFSPAAEKARGNTIAAYNKRAMAERRQKFAEVSAKALAVFSPAQRAKWNSYLGKSFEFPLPDAGPMTMTYR